MIFNKFVIPLIAVWCLSEAVLMATSSAVMVFLFKFDLWFCTDNMLMGAELNASGSRPDGKSTSGNLLLEYVIYFLEVTVGC